MVSDDRIYTFADSDRFIWENTLPLVYLLRNITNGKCYVGITRRTLSQRWFEHCKLAASGVGSMPILGAIRKYGIGSFEVSILEECSEEVLGNREQYWIATLETFVGDGKGYNATLGGDGGILGHKHSVETRKKMSENRRGAKNPNYGGLSIEHRKHVSEGRRGKGIGPRLHVRGWHHTDESRERIGAASSLHKRKTVIQCDPVTGDELNTYPSMIEAAKAVNGSPDKISAVCCGCRKTHKKFMWKILPLERGLV